MTSPMLHAIRGASTCSVDTPEEITVVTQELIVAMLTRNDLHHDDVVSVLFTTTPDLTSMFPAASARGVGFGDVPLMCASEIAVPRAMARVVRIMMHVYSSRARSEIHHVYLRHAQSLRDDLPE